MVTYSKYQIQKALTAGELHEKYLQLMIILVDMLIHGQDTIDGDVLDQEDRDVLDALLCGIPNNERSQV